MKAVVLCLGTGLFLAFVDAFGTESLPAGRRYPLFLAISVVCSLLAWAAVWVSCRIPGFDKRPWGRQLVIAVLLPLPTAAAVWAIVGFSVFKAPRPSDFPGYLMIALGMTLAMSALSQVLFRKGVLAEPDAAPPTASEIEVGPPAPAGARFLERLPPNLRGATLYAVEAEDHYVRVHTERGSTLILMRLADAASELEGLEGARVHRSWWVAKAAVTGGARRGAQTVLKLADGAEAPVSRAQVAELKRAGWF